MGKKILIVDDEPSIRDLYKRKFVDAGYDVQVAASGKQAFEMAQSFLPDALLLDLGLPVFKEDDLSGDQALEKIRAADWGKGMKVLILTNTSRDKAPSTLDNLNISRYIVKAEQSPESIIEETAEVINPKKS